MAHHKDLTGTDLHEPKGASTASSGQVYVADGSGSGAWTALKGSYVAVSRTFTDVSTAADIYSVAPVAGTIIKIFGVLEAAISVANSALTFAINGTSIDSSGMTILQSGSAAGQEYASTPSGHNTVVAGDVLKATTDGGSTTAAPFTVVWLIQVS